MRLARLKLGIPKGSLQDATIQLFARAGFNIYASTRSYFPGDRRPGDRVHADPRAGDGALRVRWRARRRADRPGLDRRARGRQRRRRARVSRSPISIYAKQSFGKVRWVLAVPEDSRYQRPQDLEGATIATELVRATQAYFARHQVNVNVEFSWGATEVKPPMLADAIVEVTETGSSLRANRLRIIDTVLESNTQLIANAAALDDAWKQTKLENIALLLKAAIEAQGRVGIMLNVRRRRSAGGARAAAGAAAADDLAAERRRTGSPSTRSSRSARCAT